MEFGSREPRVRLWRHPLFRRLLAVRVATQSGDGLLQVALASFVLFSPERQPDAASIATVLAITLLPFSVLGPFVGVVLDRCSRRQVLVVGRPEPVRARARPGRPGRDRAAHGRRSRRSFYGLVLLAMSLNRFLLAALSASLPHTIDADEYMVANSVVPTVGPAGVLVGAGVGTGAAAGARPVDAGLHARTRCCSSSPAAGFVVSARAGPAHPAPTSSGPDAADAGAAPRDVARRAWSRRSATCRERRAAGLGLLTIGGHRVVYGVVTVATILVYRNYFHTVDDVERRDRRPRPARGRHRGRLRRRGGGDPAAERPVRASAAGSSVCLVGSAVFQVLPGAIYSSVPLLVAAFLLGLTAQIIKICVDTLVQAHVDDEFKGRVFVLYDMVFNVALVLAARRSARWSCPRTASRCRCCWCWPSATSRSAPAFAASQPAA